MKTMIGFLMIEGVLIIFTFILSPSEDVLFLFPCNTEASSDCSQIRMTASPIDSTPRFQKDSRSAFFSNEDVANEELHGAESLPDNQRSQEPERAVALHDSESIARQKPGEAGLRNSSFGIEAAQFSVQGSVITGTSFNSGHSMQVRDDSWKEGIEFLLSKELPEFEARTLCYELLANPELPVDAFQTVCSRLSLVGSNNSAEALRLALEKIDGSKDRESKRKAILAALIVEWEPHIEIFKDIFPKLAESEKQWALNIIANQKPELIRTWVDNLYFSSSPSHHPLDSILLKCYWKYQENPADTNHQLYIKGNGK